jgi:hypothetical protein
MQIAGLNRGTIAGTRLYSNGISSIGSSVHRYFVISWGLKFGLFSVAIIGILLFITGAYRFSLLLTGNRTVAGYTALF